MDLLGEKGESASEAVRNLSKRVEDLESSLNAVDSAVQDLREEVDDSQESLEMEFEVTEENRSRVNELEGLLKQLADVQRTSLKEIESNRSKQSRDKSDLESRLSSLERKVEKLQSNQSSIESLLERLEQKIFSVEEELTNEVQLNQGRIESKVSEKKHEGDLSELREEFSRIKASVNALADELDEGSEDIRIE